MDIAETGSGAGFTGKQIMIKTKDWFENMLEEFQDNFDYRLETLVLNTVVSL